MPLKYLVPALVWLVIVTYLSLTPGIQMPKYTLISADKLAHAGAYALLSGLTAWGIFRSANRHISKIQQAAVFCFASGYGALMEWVQGTFFPYRFFEYDDMLANAAGALCGLFISGYILRKTSLR